MISKKAKQKIIVNSVESLMLPALNKWSGVTAMSLRGVTVSN